MNLLAAVTLVALLAVGGAPKLPPNDPAWHEQASAGDVNLPAAWAVTTGDPAVVIAVVDTGLTSSAELAPNVVPGWDFVDGDAIPTDTWGHGSQVASVAAAVGDNSIGIAGACWRCKVMPVRIAAGREVTQTRIAVGIRYAVDHGARIVNVSIDAAGPPAPELVDAVAYAVAHDVLIVASAGNNGNDDPVYPAALPGVLAVGASDEANHVEPWSTRGDWVALTAPGCEIVYDPWVGPASICGTSFTPPLVAGIAGLLLSIDQHLRASDLARILTTTATPVAGIRFGLVDAQAAVAALKVPATKPPMPARPASVRSVRVDSGRLARKQVTQIAVARGRVDIQLFSAAAARCTLAFESNDYAALALNADRNLLSLGATVPAGRYRIDLLCSKPKKTPYTLTISAAFRR